MFKKEIYIDRRNVLRKSVKSGLIVLMGNMDAQYNYADNVYHFRQDSSFLYYFGLQREEFVGVLDVDAANDRLFGDDYSLDSAVWMGNKPSVREQAESVGVTATGNMHDLAILIERAIKAGRKIHFLPQYRGDNKILLSQLLGVAVERLPQYESEELIRAVVAQRVVKSTDEIAEMERACDIGYEMHTTAMRMCRPGMTEREISGAIEGVALKRGAGVSFHNIVSQHGEILHNHDASGILEAGRMLLVDAGAETTMNYCSDFTRTFPVSGKFTPIQKDIFEIVQHAFETGINMVKPDVMFRDVHLAAAKVIAQGLTDMGIMKGNVDDAVLNGAHAMFFPTGLGHHIGLDVHDMEGLGENFVGYGYEAERSTQFGLSRLRMAKNLKEGHVMTVEPGIYFIPILVAKWENEGVNKNYINFDKVREMLGFGGVRIEDDVLVTKSGHRVLGSKRIPYTVKTIEDFMAQ